MSWLLATTVSWACNYDFVLPPNLVVSCIARQLKKWKHKIYECKVARSFGMQLLNGNILLQRCTIAVSCVYVWFFKNHWLNDFESAFFWHAHILYNGSKAFEIYALTFVYYWHMRNAKKNHLCNFQFFSLLIDGTEKKLVFFQIDIKLLPSLHVDKSTNSYLSEIKKNVEHNQLPL
jgi:hypothetical protein